MQIKVNSKLVMQVDQALLIGLKDKNEVKLNIQGNLSLEEVLDMINTATLDILQSFEDLAADKSNLNEQSKKQLKEDIYQRAVLGFSLMIDKYHPEGIKTRFNNLTEQAIMKAQDDILSSRQK